MSSDIETLIDDIRETVQDITSTISDNDDRLEKIEGAINGVNDIVAAAKDLVWYWDTTEDPITDCIEALREALRAANLHVLPRRPESGSEWVREEKDQ